MTVYTIQITTFKTGCPIKFEFNTMGARDSFLSMFINNMHKANDGDHVISVIFGERTFAA